MRTTKTLRTPICTLGSGNVFADLGLPNANELLLKAQLAIAVARFIEEKGWTQVEAAKAIRINQPKVSNLLRGRLSGFSVDRLLNILNRLDHSIEIRISANDCVPKQTRTLVSVRQSYR